MIDMSFILVNEQADGDEKIMKIKYKNRRILSSLAELNGALYQTHDKVSKK